MLELFDDKKRYCYIDFNIVAILHKFQVKTNNTKIN